MALPSFLVKKIPKLENIRRVRAILNDHRIRTVCEEAKCPNIGECWGLINRGLINQAPTVTFLILGGICTRNCAFCNVSHGRPQPPDPEEPKRIAEAVKKLGLNYVVITSVTRDDLPDGGASQFRNVGTALVAAQNSLKFEFLIPDFQGNEEALKTVLDAQPHVLNHNVETVPRLYPKIRPQANYKQSLKVLRLAKEINPMVYRKSGFMVGLGETKEEVLSVLKDLKTVGCDIVTIGQYLPPSRNHIKPERYVTPEEFDQYRTYGEALGLKVLAGPFVRSSYCAGKIFKYSHQN